MIHLGVAAVRAGSARLVQLDVGDGNLSAVTPAARRALQDAEPSDPWATVHVSRGLRIAFPVCVDAMRRQFG